MACCRCAQTHHDGCALSPFFHNRDRKGQQEDHQHTGQIDQGRLAHIAENVLCIISSHRCSGQIIGDNAQCHIDEVLVFDKGTQRFPCILLFLHMTTGAFGNIFTDQQNCQHAGNDGHHCKNCGDDGIGGLVFPHGRKQTGNHKTNHHNRDQRAVRLEYAQHGTVVRFGRNQVDHAVAGNADHGAKHRARQKIHGRTEDRFFQHRKLCRAAKQQHHGGGKTERTRQ